VPRPSASIEPSCRLTSGFATGIVSAACNATGIRSLRIKFAAPSRNVGVFGVNGISSMGRLARRVGDVYHNSLPLGIDSSSDAPALRLVRFAQFIEVHVWAWVGDWCVVCRGLMFGAAFRVCRPSCGYSVAQLRGRQSSEFVDRCGGTGARGAIGFGCIGERRSCITLTMVSVAKS
jgi:hypothetical protein